MCPFRPMGVTRRIPALCIAVILMLTAAHGFARDNVVICQLNWSSSIAVSHVMKAILETRLGIPTEIRPLSQPVAWSALAEGSADVYSEIWMPNQADAFHRYVQQGKTVLARKSYQEAPQGLYLAASVANEHDIRSVFDLKGKESLFDMDGDGVGEMWVGPYNWAASRINRSKIREYGIRFTPLAYEQWVFVALLKEAMTQDKPLVFYYWEPDWPTAIYDLVRLTEPPHSLAQWAIDSDGPDGPRYRCAYPPATVYIGISSRLQDRLPKAFAFFLRWRIPIRDVSRLVAEIEDVPGNPAKDPAQVAQDWIDAHPGQVNDWLQDEASEPPLSN
jgi:glycine betaine/proline transport system substrate-binding protein